VIYEYLLKDLLEGKIIDEETIEERIKFLDWNLKKNIYIMAIRPEVLGIHAVSTIVSNLQDRISGSRAIFYNQDIILVFSQDEDISKDEEKLLLFKKFLQRERMYAGISRSFKSLIDIHEHYNQAIEALGIGKDIYSRENLFYYEDCAMYILFENFRDLKNLKSLCHPALFVLSEYDKKNGTDFMQCLRNYLIFDKNPAKVASVMFVHRNTINYRINKIQEITNIDFDNYEINLHLAISFKIQEYLLAKKENLSSIID
jgi:sugar diacid utilization regulator